jgi:rubrerythrin
MAHLQTFPGAACCHTTELATLQSGSPPGAGQWRHRQTFPGTDPATARATIITSCRDKRGSFSLLCRYRPNVSRSFSDLGEREVLALAISLEEEDSRIYRDYAERMKEKYPETASILQSMHEVELAHHRRLIEVFQGRFGDHIPYLRRQDVKGFIKRKPIWLNIHLKPKRVRQDVMGMEAESRRFYQQAVEQVKSPEVRVLLQELAAVEEDHQDIFVEEVKKKKKSGALAKEEE